jgi:hypothetical protein
LLRTTDSIEGDAVIEGDAAAVVAANDVSHVRIRDRVPGDVPDDGVVNADDIAPDAN